MMDLKKMKPGTRVTVTLSAQDLLVICSSLEPGRYDLVRPVMQSLEAQIFPQIEQRDQQGVPLISVPKVPVLCLRKRGRKCRAHR